MLSVACASSFAASLVEPMTRELSCQTGGDLPTTADILLYDSPRGRATYHRQFHVISRKKMQSAWLILLHCAVARANFLLRIVGPDSEEQFPHNHDHQIWCTDSGRGREQCEAGELCAESVVEVRAKLGDLGTKMVGLVRDIRRWK